MSEKVAHDQPTILTKADIERALQDAMFAIRAKHANTDVERIRDLANTALGLMDGWDEATLRHVKENDAARIRADSAEARLDALRVQTDHDAKHIPDLTARIRALEEVVQAVRWFSGVCPDACEHDDCAHVRDSLSRLDARALLTSERADVKGQK